MIARQEILDRLRAAMARSPVTVLTRPHQCGKTTLARELLSETSPNYFDLEDPVSLARLDEPMTALGPLEGLVVIDEVQRRPDLFPVLRVLVDRRSGPARFLILGSASGDLLRQSSESLAGRTARITIGGFTVADLGADSAGRLWGRGGFPLAYLAPTEQDSNDWRGNFIQKLGASWEGFVIEQILAARVSRRSLFLGDASGRRNRPRSPLWRSLARCRVQAARRAPGYTFKLSKLRPTPDGRTVLALLPLEFLTALGRLIPPRRVHRHSYHGVLGPRTRLRVRVVGLGRTEWDSQRAAGPSSALHPGDSPERRRTLEMSSTRRPRTSLRRPPVRRNVARNRCMKGIVRDLSDRGPSTSAPWKASLVLPSRTWQVLPEPPERAGNNEETAAT